MQSLFFVKSFHVHIAFDLILILRALQVRTFNSSYRLIGIQEYSIMKLAAFQRNNRHVYYLFMAISVYSPTLLYMIVNGEDIYMILTIMLFCVDLRWWNEWRNGCLWYCISKQLTHSYLVGSYFFRAREDFIIHYFLLRVLLDCFSFVFLGLPTA